MERHIPIHAITTEQSAAAATPSRFQEFDAGPGNFGTSGSSYSTCIEVISSR